jgi:thymidylate synthase ThyX
MIKTTINAKIIADSKNQFGNRITTMLVTFPRIILAEFNTHRMFSRNTASSRAIPFEKMLKSIEEDPFIPIAWQKDHKGMQGTEYFIDKEDIEYFERQYLSARDYSVGIAKNLNIEGKGVTKQICNRLLESYMWTTVIVTATEWENFFALRCPRYSGSVETYRSRKDVINSLTKEGHSLETFTNLSEVDWLKRNEGQAEIHMMALAEAMYDAYNESTPRELKEGDWHIPFGDNLHNDDNFKRFIIDNSLIDNQMQVFKESKIKVATARCARVSYTVVGEEAQEFNYENDIKLHDRLLESKHMSPFEHCAKAMPNSYFDGTPANWSGNFKGFIQYRKLIPNENITK